MRKLLAILILIQFSAYAEMDSHDKKALQETKALMQNPVERQKVIDKDAHAKDVDNKVNALVGTGANKEDLYGLAAELMDKITAEANGDPDKMQKLMNEAQKDPKAFYQKYFSAEQKEKTRGIANKIESGRVGASPRK